MFHIRFNGNGLSAALVQDEFNLCLEMSFCDLLEKRNDKKCHSICLAQLRAFP